jgi:hypothetical protein
MTGFPAALLFWVLGAGERSVRGDRAVRSARMGRMGPVSSGVDGVVMDNNRRQLVRLTLSYFGCF